MFSSGESERPTEALGPGKTTDVIGPLPGEVCSLCGEKKPERLSSTERVQAHRKRKRNES